MTPIDAQTPLEITLAAEQWNQVLGLLGEVPAPYRVTAPLIQAIGGQMQQQAAHSQMEQQAAAPVPNGDGRMVPRMPIGDATAV
jgi:hypothetical protein